MSWIRRRGYGQPYDPYYYDRRPPRSSSCLRDACLVETGCCLAESLDDNCLMLTLPLLPALLTAGLFTPRRGGLLAMIRIYQRDISANRPACCRFSPSCSEYSAQAIERHGAVRGAVLAARRLLRCRPGGARGLDPIPG